MAHRCFVILKRFAQPLCALLPIQASYSRPTLRLTTLNLVVALWLLLLLNRPFWSALWQATGGWDSGHLGFLLTLPLFVLAWLWLVVEALTWGLAAKPMLVLLLLASAAASYFMNTYGVVFDRIMIANLVETHRAEVLELLNGRLAASLLAFGVLPALLLWRVRLLRQRWPRQLLAKGIAMAAAASCMVLLVAPFFQSYAALLRNHRELRFQLVPTNVLGAAHGYARSRWAAPVTLQAVGTDAIRRPQAVAGAKPRLLLLMVGETARAANFSLNGYGRPTNPALGAMADLVNFRQVSSCGTSTAVSLPCMFLDVGRARFDDELARHRESLLDVVQRAGVAVLWRDNNSGCKGVCDRVPHEDLSAAQVPGLCDGGECHDEILLDGLQAWIDRQDHDALVVLHMKGSHGPAYHLRYPPAFEFFKPACKADEIDRCEREQIVNAYDNTLRYTDHVLALTIELLRRNGGRFDTSMLYVSDHGESLGEHGVYLHGLPYSMAPREQTHVPMLLWLSPALREHAGIDAACLERRRDEPLSHDHLYHSVLDLLGVQTQAYRAERDLLRGCIAALPTPRTP